MQSTSSEHSNQHMKASAALKIILGGSILYLGIILIFAQIFSAIL